MSEQTDSVTHPGIVMQISGHVAEVMILAKSACTSCQVKGACNMSEMEEKRVFVELPPEHSFKSGQQVNVMMKQSLGNFAVFLGYILPFLVLLLTLIISISVGLGEGVAGLLALGILVPYYFVLYRLRNRLGRKFSFQLTA
ncbi:MAG: SoxR reducing system RseC family protein [Bacteroidales bacterium]|jgi:sigma-E factor negative regulatory protein RseC|nr:SoxR reducing system RseC family protein [Bacteroidales bacterium]MDN5349307.1 hypothetical protein [Bacteroidales bacterium]